MTGSSGGSVTKSLTCDTCPAGTTNVALDDILGPATTCDATLCAINEHVVNNVCVSCGDNINDAGDDASGADTTCDCKANFRVLTSYASDNTKKYGSTACTTKSDCETKCSSDSACLGYTGGTRPVAVYSGGGTIYALYMNGDVYGWGYSYHDSLGKDYSNGVAKSTAELIVSGALDLGTTEGYGNCIITSTTTKCWGENAGFGSTPTDVTEFGNGALSVSFGYKYACAVLADGTVACKGSTGNVPTVPSGITNAKKIATSEDKIVLVLLNDGTLKSFGGSNAAAFIGMYGDGTSGSGNQDDELHTVSINNVIDMSCGLNFCCAVKSDGTVKCWGKDDYGQLGNGGDNTDAAQSTPVDVTGVSDVVQVSCTGNTAAVLSSDGKIHMWGRNWNGLMSSATSGNH